MTCESLKKLYKSSKETFAKFAFQLLKSLKNLLKL